jgi:ubiquinone/menaquinone biosynthesis C-methylase UbiE
MTGRTRGGTSEPAASEQIALSVSKYRWSYWRYERAHPEIFNPIEQDRLRRALQEALDALEKPPQEVVALDLGCGSGNLTRHLLELGARVVAADVSPQFLRLVRRRYESSGRLATRLVNGQDLAGIEHGAFDLACAYSVLHHIPDYVSMVGEMARVVRPGGAIYLDHEANQNFWDKSSCFWQLLDAVAEHRRARAGFWDPERRRWQRYLVPAKYYVRFRQLFDPGYPWNVEGDIHVWDSDHIEWDLVEERLVAAGCEIAAREDYLGYSSDYPDEVWERFRDTCTNMRLTVARRRH